MGSSGNVQATGSLPPPAVSAGQGAGSSGSTFQPSPVYSGNRSPVANYPYYTPSPPLYSQPVGNKGTVQQSGPLDAIGGAIAGGIGALGSGIGALGQNALQGINDIIGPGSNFATGAAALEGAPNAVAKIVTGQPLNNTDIANLSAATGHPPTNPFVALGQAAGGLAASVGSIIGVTGRGAAPGVATGAAGAASGVANVAVSGLGGAASGSVLGGIQGVGNALDAGGTVGGIPVLVLVGFGALLVLLVVGKK
jgi:hypothetical protein